MLLLPTAGPGSGSPDSWVPRVRGGFVKVGMVVVASGQISQHGSALGVGHLVDNVKSGVLGCLALGPWSGNRPASAKVLMLVHASALGAVVGWRASEVDKLRLSRLGAHRMGLMYYSDDERLAIERVRAYNLQARLIRARCGCVTLPERRV